MPDCPKEVVNKLVEIREKLIESAIDPGSPLWVDSGNYSGDFNETNDSSVDDEDVELINHKATLRRIAAASPQAITLSTRQIIRAARRASKANFEKSTFAERRGYWN